MGWLYWATVIVVGIFGLRLMILWREWRHNAFLWMGIMLFSGIIVSLAINSWVPLAVGGALAGGIRLFGSGEKI